ncbi:MAG: hypothetical protein ACTSQA_07140, partial [Candidatus Heimdallarchaeaceae archaeon]
RVESVESVSRLILDQRRVMKNKVLHRGVTAQHEKINLPNCDSTGLWESFLVTRGNSLPNLSKLSK